jgi:hypothetical protein
VEPFAKSSYRSDFSWGHIVYVRKQLTANDDTLTLTRPLRAVDPTAPTPNDQPNPTGSLSDGELAEIEQAIRDNEPRVVTMNWGDRILLATTVLDDGTLQR